MSANGGPSGAEFLDHPSFWGPEHVMESAWLAHAPFAFWLMKAHRPRLLVELGTHRGFSYLAFCQAALRLGLDLRAFAIDTWRGDEHAGFYGDEVLHQLRAVHDPAYGSFSQLVQSTFDGAVNHFDDASIDLLHIDGLHTYVAVRHDFDTWLPKLSPHAIVLLHDIEVRESDFGVHRLWTELEDRYPSFRFTHGHGLGLLAVGSAVHGLVETLTEQPDDGAAAALTRSAYARLGSAVQDAYLQDVTARRREDQFDESLEAAHRDSLKLRAALDEASLAAHTVEEERSALFQDVENLTQSLASSRRQLRDLARHREDLIAEIVRERRGVSAGTALVPDVGATTGDEPAPARAAISENGEPHALNIDPKGSPAVLALIGLALWLKAVLMGRAGRMTLHQLLDLGILARAGAVDGAAYSVAYPDVAAARRDPRVHYVRWGWREHRDPSTWFSTSRYLDSYPDVASAGINPLIHYLRNGRAEGRSPKGATAQVAATDITTARSASDARPSVVFVSGEPQTPGHEYRVVDIAAALPPAEFRTTILSVADVEAGEHQVHAADVLWIWRALLTPALEAMISTVRSGGGKVIFDVDDLMFDPNLATVDVIDGIRSQGLPESAVAWHFAQIAETATHADLTTAPTRLLSTRLNILGVPGAVIPNGFDSGELRTATEARLLAAKEATDQVRIGYAAGSRTHQRDLAVAIPALCRVLSENPTARLVLFEGCVDVTEFPDLVSRTHQIEWRPWVPKRELPLEYARFDINIAPLEVGNPFCEAKSSLKFFEAALVDVPTVASPTEPFRSAIAHGTTGFLSSNDDEWYAALSELMDAEARKRIGRAAREAVLLPFGPEQRRRSVQSALQQVYGSPSVAATVFSRESMSTQPRGRPQVATTTTLFERRNSRSSAVTIVVPLFNYASVIIECLESARDRTLEDVDLIVVDDCSTDGSAEIVLSWMRRHAADFNRLLLLRNNANSGLPVTRNTGIEAAETEYVFPLDADNLLTPSCLERCLAHIAYTGAAFVYPWAQSFGADDVVFGTAEWSPTRLRHGNFVDAMALVSRAVWQSVGGYTVMAVTGWEDFEFWCKLVEDGWFGASCPDASVRYRVHPQSMLRTVTEQSDNRGRLANEMLERHPWLTLRPAEPEMQFTNEWSEDADARLDRLLPMMRCPETREALRRVGDRLVTVTTGRDWPIVAGRPVFTPAGALVARLPEEHLSNKIPAHIGDLMDRTKGMVLNLSAGGSVTRRDNVVELEYAVFRNTDIVGDAHVLPFADDTFEIVIAMNAFEHYRDPQAVLSEIRRVLVPGGRLVLHTAFLQPSHEAPHHYYNVTRDGLLEWLREFDIEDVSVTSNFSPAHSVSWLLSETESALRQGLSEAAAEEFGAMTVGEWVSLWRDESRRDGSIPWTRFAQLPDRLQTRTAAGFEAWARNPVGP